MNQKQFNRALVDLAKEDLKNGIRPKVQTLGCNRSESAFANIVATRGRPWARNGWPDFLVEHRGRLIGVEVKDGKDYLRDSQMRMAALLERAGIKVYVWRPKKPDVLTPWRKDAQQTGVAIPRGI